MSGHGWKSMQWPKISQCSSWMQVHGCIATYITSDYSGYSLAKHDIPPVECGQVPRQYCLLYYYPVNFTVIVYECMTLWGWPYRTDSTKHDGWSLTMYYCILSYAEFEFFIVFVSTGFCCWLEEFRFSLLFKGVCFAERGIVTLHGTREK